MISVQIRHTVGKLQILPTRLQNTLRPPITHGLTGVAPVVSYSGGVDIERLYSNPPWVPYRPVYLAFFVMLILIFKFADHYQVLIQVPIHHFLTTLQLLAQQRIYNINTALGLPSRAMNASTIIRSAIPRKVATVIN